MTSIGTAPCLTGSVWPDGRTRSAPRRDRELLPTPAISFKRSSIPAEKKYEVYITELGGTTKTHHDPGSDFQQGHLARNGRDRMEPSRGSTGTTQKLWVMNRDGQHPIA